jgi:putative transposase
MPVHRHKKDTTPTPSGSTQEQVAPPLPNQQTFQQYLRELARRAIRVVLEGVMREELDALIGVGWGESSPKRKGYRNGSYTHGMRNELAASKRSDFRSFFAAFVFSVMKRNAHEMTSKQ